MDQLHIHLLILHQLGLEVFKHACSTLVKHYTDNSMHKVKTQCNIAELEYLNSLKASHSKLDNLKYQTLDIQSYLVSSSIYPNMAQQIFKWRTRMESFRANFRNGNDDISCKLGCMEDDSQENFLNCKVIKDYVFTERTDYFKIFSNNVNQVKSTMQVILKAWHIRSSLLTLNTNLRNVEESASQT